MSRKIGLVIILILSGLFLYSLGQQIYNSLLVAKRLDQEADNLARLQQKNQQLKEQARQAKSVGFIETQARNKLSFARQGETVVVISQSELDKILGEEKSIEIKKPNWQGWLRLFF